MKKSTKIITTAIALALVVGAMVVGIYAATSASAAITASVNWTATAGLEFTVNGWTYYSKEHYNTSSKQFPQISTHTMSEIIVDTTTTNTAASSTSTGMKRTLSANFIDTTDDGVNDPKSMFYLYAIRNNADKALSVTVTDYPVSNSNIKVEYFVGLSTQVTPIHPGYVVGGYPLEGAGAISVSTTPVTSFTVDDEYQHTIYVLKLTILTPDTSISGFDASVSFSFS